MSDNLSIYFVATFKHSEDGRFACSAASSFASDPSSSEVTFIEFHFPVLERTFRFAKRGDTRAEFCINPIDGNAIQMQKLGGLPSLQIQAKHP